LDDFVAHVNAPQLNDLNITFFNDIIFDTPQIFQFICRAPRLAAPKDARIIFNDFIAGVDLISTDYNLYLKISCRDLVWQVSSLEQICISYMPPIFTVEDLYFSENTYWQSNPRDNDDNAQWLELLHPFRAVKNLYLHKEVVPRIVPALQELIGHRATEVLPTLQNIFLEGLEARAIGTYPGRCWEVYFCATDRQ
jgi:hypothetical protein